MAAVNGRFRPEEAVTAVELAQFCSTRLGRTPSLGGWSQLTHGEFFPMMRDLLDQ